MSTTTANTAANAAQQAATGVLNALVGEFNLLSHEIMAAEEKAADAVGLGDLQRQVDEDWSLDLNLKIKPSRVLCVVLSLILLKSLWQSVPDWARPTWLQKKKRHELADDKDANDDLASPRMIFQKLVQMMRLASQKCATVTPDDMPW